MTSSRAIVILLSAAIAAACISPRDEAPLASRGNAATIDTVVVTGSAQILNRYAVLTTDATVGGLTLVVEDATTLSSPAPLAAGDLVLVSQAQGAEINASDSAGYGFVTDRAGAGDFEIVPVASVSGNRITLDPGCALTRGYRAAGATQVVRVPVIGDLVVDSSGSITAPSWDGRSGGIVALVVQRRLTLSGKVDVRGRGLRGGVRDNTSAASTTSDVEYKSPVAADGGSKGESIAGFDAIYDARFGGRYARGAPANGGGGGTSHNGGGGGGANGDSHDGWSGDGVMDPDTIGASAWTLDPRAQIFGKLAHSSGGGRGGYSYSANDADALTTPPGDPLWAGNQRRDRGGRGGHPLANAPAGPLFMGGGGGAGDSNDNAGGSGGAGGGLVLIISDRIGGGGTILASGASGENTRNAGNDGPGGGGAGGAVVVVAGSGGGFSIDASGGSGGKQAIATLEAEGPGGGGGGGYIAVGGATPAFRLALAGSNGTTNSSSLSEFPANGATRGAGGQADELALPIDIPACPRLVLTPPAGYDVAGSGGCRAGGKPARAASFFALGALALAILARRRGARS